MIVAIANMLHYLQWPTLEHQRKTAHLILLFKIMMKLLIVPDCCLPVKVPVESTRAHHSLKLAHLQCRLDIYKYSFSPKTIALRNNLNVRNLDTCNDSR